MTESDSKSPEAVIKGRIPSWVNALSPNERDELQAMLDAAYRKGKDDLRRAWEVIDKYGDALTALKDR